MNLKSKNSLFQKFYEVNPDPKTELIYSSDFTLLISVILSAQSTDLAVNKATKFLFEKHNTPQTILSLSEEGLKEYIKTIGLYNSKASNIIKTCNIIIEKYNSIVPRNFDDLISLPGVGRKTANVVINALTGAPTIAVDTHVFRVSKRIGIANGKTPEAVEMQLIKNIPKKWIPKAHHWLVLHGRYVCTAKKPKCHICLVKDECKYYNKIFNKE